MTPGVRDILVAAFLMQLCMSHNPAVADDTAIVPVPFQKVTFEDRFWAPRLRTNRQVTVPHNLAQLEKQGSLGGFRILAGTSDETYHGWTWGDSDLYKTLEGMIHTAAVDGPGGDLLKEQIETIVASIVGSQRNDGFLFPYLQITDPNYAIFSGETHRFTESYSMGHMIEAAVAHHDLTGKTNFLVAACRTADLMVRLHDRDKFKIAGHPEIELALIKLYRTTRHEAYLDLAEGLIRQNRAQNTLWTQGPPALGHDEAIGHAVAMLYLYCAVTDLAMIRDDTELLGLMQKKWQNIVGRKLYLTGGLGHRDHSEGFPSDYDLSNDRAYCETCAGIANVFWQQRLFMAHGEAVYVDVLERSLYNNVLGGAHMDGDRSFYVNPLSCSGKLGFNHGSRTRNAWYGCPCCPTNLVRLFPTVGAYLYAKRGQRLYVNLFAQSRAEIDMPQGKVHVIQSTDYPWAGKVTLTVRSDAPIHLPLYVRVPGWARARPVPSDLYRYLEQDSAIVPVVLTINGKVEAIRLEKGYAVMDRTWQSGDKLELHLPMPVRRVLAHPKVKADAGRVALERGPIVYCAEAIDNGGSVQHLVLPDDGALNAQHKKDLLGGIQVITGQAVATSYGEGGAIAQTEQAFAAIPYYAWNHRTHGPMTVWLARDMETASPLPIPTIASRSRVSASHCFGRGDTVEAMNDQIEPANSADLTVPRHTWWDHRGTDEWVQYDFDEPTPISGVSVYWFDDTETGQCRVPRSWDLRYRTGSSWKKVAARGQFGVAKDTYNRVEFAPVTAEALKIRVKLQQAYSGGILEWRVLEAK